MSNETVPISKEEIILVIFHGDSELLVSPLSYLLILWLICAMTFLHCPQWYQLQHLRCVDSWFPGIHHHAGLHTSLYISFTHAQRELLLVSGSQFRVAEGIKKQYLNSYKKP